MQSTPVRIKPAIPRVSIPEFMSKAEAIISADMTKLIDCLLLELLILPRIESSPTCLNFISMAPL